MYYRRKILLSLLQVFDNQLDKISLQKLLFLLAQQQEEKSFYFVPYKLGCFSFQANADLNTLTKYNIVEATEKSWLKADKIDYLSELKPKDKSVLLNVQKLYSKLSKDDLIALTYREFPYYAINSVIAQNILTVPELTKIKEQKPSSKVNCLFTIGYEGVSLEQYINKLIVNDVKVLCDVRKNPLSMKYGFSKSQLQNACVGVGIEYFHFPEVGISSDKRQELNSQADYEILFSEYRVSTLLNETSKQKEILNLLNVKKRIALTCFEANINQCHRKHLAESLTHFAEFKAELKHI